MLQQLLQQKCSIVRTGVRAQILTKYLILIYLSAVWRLNPIASPVFAAQLLHTFGSKRRVTEAIYGIHERASR
ncbi:MAG: hypothetical protein H0V72_28065 [Bradyrhizobium sp.]|nr:hypothetical protein [Bradyrhizobium sp.]